MSNEAIKILQRIKSPKLTNQTFFNQPIGSFRENTVNSNTNNKRIALLDDLDYLWWGK